MQTINSQKAPQAIGPYSQAVRVGDFVYCSGQIGLDPKIMDLVDGIEDQTIQVCKNVGEVLKEASLSYENVIKTTIFLKNISDFSIVNEIYGKYFSHKPARSTIEVSNLPKDALIEIEVVAYIK